MASTLGPVPLGPFDLERPIGRGGMAEVWLGVHRAQQQRVAVKVLTGERAREDAFIRSLKNEIHNVARLHHPGIILLFDNGEVDGDAEKFTEGRFVAGSPWFAMELASHGALSPKRLPLPWPTSRMLLLSLLDALAHAHARGVIHRDIKPGNILLCAPEDPRPGLKLTDFGIASPLGEHIDGEAEAGRLSGTPRYMAPEQFQAKWRDFGPWTDLYALGCIAYQLATGKAPFSGDALRLAIAHCHDAPEPPKPAIEGYPAGFDAWTLRLLEKEPQRRFSCAADAAWSLLKLHTGDEQRAGGDGDATAVSGWEQDLRSLKPLLEKSSPDGSTVILPASGSDDAISGESEESDRVARPSDVAETAAIARAIESTQQTIVDRPKSMMSKVETLTATAPKKKGATATKPARKKGRGKRKGQSQEESAEASAARLDGPHSLEPTATMAARKGGAPWATRSAESSVFTTNPPPLPGDGDDAFPPIGAGDGPEVSISSAPTGTPAGIVETTFAPNVPWTELAMLSPKDSVPTTSGRAVEVGRRRHDGVDESKLAPRTPPPLPPSWRRPGAAAPSRHLLGAGLGLYGLRQIPLVDRDAERDRIWDALRAVHEGRGSRVVVVRGPAGIGKTRLCEWLVERAVEVGAGIGLRAGHGPGGGPLDGLPGLVALHARTVGLERRGLRRRLADLVQRRGGRDLEEALALAELVEPSPEPPGSNVAGAPANSVVGPAPASGKGGGAVRPAMKAAVTTSAHASAGRGALESASGSSLDIHVSVVSQTANAAAAGSAPPARATEARIVDDVSGEIVITGDQQAVRLDSARERHAVALRYLMRAADERPAVAWLDDVQWGADAIAFARFVLDDERGKRSPVLVILSASEEALGERPLEAAALDELAKQHGTTGNVVTVRLSTLPAADHLALVQELLGLEQSLARQVAERTLGNPLFAVQLVGDFIMRGVLVLTAEGFGLRKGERAVLPDDLHGVWSERIRRVLQRCDERGAKDAGRALELGAILSTAGDDGEWAAICEEAGVELNQVLIDELLVARLIVPDEAGLRFAHAMLRESVLRGAAEDGRLDGHHATAARMLLKRYGDRRGTAERVGRHLVLAGQIDEALPQLMRAADEAARTQGYAQAHALLAERDAAVDKLGLPEADPRRAEGWALKASLLVDEGRYDEALMWANLVLRYRDDARHRNVVPTALRVQAVVSLRKARWDEAAARFVEGIKASEAAGDGDCSMQCHVGLADTAYYRGKMQQAGDELARALAICQERGDDAGVSFCLWNSSYVALWLGNLEEARAMLLRQQKLAKRAGHRSMIANGRNALGDLERMSGRYDEAEDRYLDALQLFEAIGSGKRRVVRTNLAVNALARGNLDKARSLATEVLAEVQKSGERVLISLCHGVLAAISANDRQWEAHDQHVLGLQVPHKETGLVDGEHAVLYEIIGDYARMHANDERAARAYESAIDLWGQLGRKDRIDSVERALGKLGTVKMQRPPPKRGSGSRPTKL